MSFKSSALRRQNKCRDRTGHEDGIPWWRKKLKLSKVTLSRTAYAKATVLMLRIFHGS